MSIIDKVLGAATPPESEEKRAEATAKARAVARPGDWLGAALDHHDQIRAGFDACREAQDGPSRLEAMRRLSRVLIGHSVAEEVVLYPALAKAHEKSHATLAYTEQTTAKMQMAELERISPDDAAWADKLEHIRGAVLHHIFEEEGFWFLEIKDKYDDQGFLDRRFIEEYERYAGEPGADRARTPDEPRSFDRDHKAPSDRDGRDAGRLKDGQGSMG